MTFLPLIRLGVVYFLFVYRRCKSISFLATLKAFLLSDVDGCQLFVKTRLSLVESEVSSCLKVGAGGTTENAGRENVAQSKMQGWKVRDMENATQQCNCAKCGKKFAWKAITA